MLTAEASTAKHEPSHLTELIHSAVQGDPTAADRLFAAMYRDLRRLARARLRAGGRNTLLDTSALVHESYLRFAGAGRLQLENRVHFLRWAGRVMRSIIVDFARRRLADRRGGGATPLSTFDSLFSRSSICGTTRFRRTGNPPMRRRWLHLR